MRTEVQVRLVDSTVVGLLLKWNRGRDRALVTYERDGHVESSWVLAETLSPSG